MDARLQYDPIFVKQRFGRLDEPIAIDTSAGTYDRRYCWPVKDRQPMPEGVDNCATWPRVLGLELPEPTGILSVYIEALRDQGHRRP